MRMKIKTFNDENNELIHVYIEASECTNAEITQEINQIKKQHSNVAIFVSGNNNTVKTIKEMLNYEKNRN